MIYRIVKRLFVYLIFSVSVLFSSNKNVKSEENFYVIDKSFDETVFMEDLKKLSGYKKKVPLRRADWIYKLTAVVTSYKTHFRTVSVIKRNNKYEAIITAKRGEIFYFADGRMLPPDDLSDDKNFSSYFYKYPLGSESHDKPKRMNFPKPVNYAFLNSLYGYYHSERENDLEKFYALERRLRFHSRQNASLFLKKVLSRLQSEADGDYDIRKWYDSIQFVYTFINREVQNAGRQSLHSYGIALDILPYNRQKHLYWQWAEEFKKDWWNIEEKDKAFVPDKVIEIFESQGFVWGGKWYFFDIMHFEYRPEIIKYNRLLRDDPLNKNIENVQK